MEMNEAPQRVVVTATHSLEQVLGALALLFEIWRGWKVDVRNIARIWPVSRLTANTWPY